MIDLVAVVFPSVLFLLIYSRLDDLFGKLESILDKDRRHMYRRYMYRKLLKKLRKRVHSESESESDAEKEKEDDADEDSVDTEESASAEDLDMPTNSLFHEMSPDQATELAKQAQPTFREASAFTKRMDNVFQLSKEDRVQVNKGLAAVAPFSPVEPYVTIATPQMDDVIPVSDKLYITSGPIQVGATCVSILAPEVILSDHSIIPETCSITRLYRQPENNVPVESEISVNDETAALPPTS